MSAQTRNFMSQFIAMFEGAIQIDTERLNPTYWTLRDKFELAHYLKKSLHRRHA